MVPIFSKTPFLTIAENAEVDIATLHLVEVHLIRSAVAGRQLLEKEHLGHETAQYGVSEKKCLQVQADLLELLLNTANEYSETGRRHGR